MAYATTAEVQALLDTKGIALATAKITLAEVTAWIAEFEAQINGMLSAQGYETVPATGANDVPMLRRFSSERTAFKVFTRHYHMQELPEDVRGWKQDYDEFLANIRRGAQQLVDQLPRSEDQGEFLIVRTPTRDDYFTDRTADELDWDET